jgi:hydroxyacylglutathione hydrolase
MMLMQRFYDDKLAQASYLIGSTDARVAIVVDPSRNVEPYLAAAEAEGLRIAHVAETHIHADFVSGSRELAARTGARIHLSGEGGAEWQYAFAHESGVVPLVDGDTIDVGTVRLQALHTPGHTPEHLAFLVTDLAVADEPVAMLTGDFIFVGDVGRPDLLEKAAGVGGTMEPAARALFQSLKRLQPFPDYLQIWPGHGAGSACGKGLGALPATTLGYERRHNWAFAARDEEAFVCRVLSGQPDPPHYFALMKRVNREGPRVLGGRPDPVRLPAARLESTLAGGALVVDTRAADDVAIAFIPGTLNIPLTRSFSTWAGWLLPYTAELYLIAEPERVDEAVASLTSIGLDRIAGVFDDDVVRGWVRAGLDLERLPQIDAATLHRRLGMEPLLVLDVRSQAEWEDGHIPGARHIPLGELGARAGELPASARLVVYCQGGARSAIAASLLRSRRFAVVNFSAGFDGWRRAGYAVERGQGALAVSAR